MAGRVVHCRREKFDVYIGRAFGNMPQSKWHNPFHIGRDGTREQVIAKFRVYLLRSPQLVAALPELVGKVLGCWCDPEDCHGRVLVKLSETNPIELQALVKEQIDCDNLQMSIQSRRDGTSGIYGPL